MTMQTEFQTVLKPHTPWPESLIEARELVLVKYRIARLIKALRPVPGLWLPTIAVDESLRLFFNDTYIETLPVSRRAGALVHELFHVMREHPLRLRLLRARVAVQAATYKTRKARRDHQFNVKAGHFSCDFEIDDDIREDCQRWKGQILLPDGCLYPEMYGLDEGDVMESYYFKLAGKLDESDDDDLQKVDERKKERDDEQDGDPQGGNSGRDGQDEQPGGDEGESVASPGVPPESATGNASEGTSSGGGDLSSVGPKVDGESKSDDSRGADGSGGDSAGEDEEGDDLDDDESGEPAGGQASPETEDGGAAPAGEDEPGDDDLPAGDQNAAAPESPEDEDEGASEEEGEAEPGDAAEDDEDSGEEDGDESGRDDDADGDPKSGDDGDRREVDPEAKGEKDNPIEHDQILCGSFALEGELPESIKKLIEEADAEEELTTKDVEEILDQLAEELLEHAANVGIGSAPGSQYVWARQRKSFQYRWEQYFSRALGTLRDTRPGGEPTYRRASRRQAAVVDVILPGRQSVKPRIGVIGDTSGSMGKYEIDSVLETLPGLVEAAGGELIWAACDTTIHHVQTVKSGRDAIKWAGGGGTDMSRAVKWAADYTPKFDVIVVLTDGETGWPASPCGTARVVVGIVNANYEECQYYMKRVPGWMTTVAICPRPEYGG